MIFGCKIIIKLSFITMIFDSFTDIFDISVIFFLSSSKVTAFIQINKFNETTMF